MNDFYEITGRIASLAGLLQDDLSRAVFQARLQFDICPTGAGYLKLGSLSGLFSAEEFEKQGAWKKTVKNLLKEGKKILLYGAGLRGNIIAKCFENEEIDFAFCDKNYEKFPDGLKGKRVHSPAWLLEHGDECCVIITSAAFRDEIVSFLLANKFPADHILPYFSGFTFDDTIRSKQYFEFPALFPKGTAFVDAGCYDGKDSVYFAAWCGGDYSKILAFEPDSANYERCKTNLADTPRTDVIHAGLGDRSASETFLSYGLYHSRFENSKKRINDIRDTAIANANIETIQVVSLDDIAGEDTIGFIKMDIEGSEWQALHGAEKVIERDKPLLAICVYHVPGDMLAIMDYLSALVPDYRFWLRHYETSNSETVLYAAIKSL